ncbi:coiled-coil domain-containing protein 177 [Bombina bombina]|uniref:coiled-coil domain-containing protein 177 n=1 Tax=Bombina bombina TaxID=8345 RepID=UPI00235AD03D|nr:coiled-coil domain-containing protein 177 [Bombina bombina]
MTMAAPAEDPGGEDVSVGISGRQRENSPMLHLDLYNFECPEAEGSRYVLTSPRSLEACARCMVKPVELLARSLSDLVREAPGRSMRVASGLCEVYEIERQRKLQLCREERERIIRQEKRRILPLVLTSGLGSPTSSKGPSRAEPSASIRSHVNENSESIDLKSNNPLPSCRTQKTNHPHSKDVERSDSPLYRDSKKSHQSVSRRPKKTDTPLTRDSPAFKEPSTAVSPKKKSHSLDSLQKMKDGASTKTSSGSATSSYSGESARDKSAHYTVRPKSLDNVNNLMGRSFSLGDLSHSPQTTKKVERMVKEVKKRGVQELPQRDKKIAALMIAKHQEENIRNEQRYWAHLQWETQRRNAEQRKEKEDRERHRSFLHGHKLLESEARGRRSRVSSEMLSASSLNQNKKFQQEHNLKSKEENMKESLAQDEGESKEKKITDLPKKQEKDQLLQKQKSAQNKAEKIRHHVLLQELVNKEEYEKEGLKKALEMNLQKAQENVEQLFEKRQKELRDRAQREELQIQKAREAAEKRERERREHLKELSKTAEKRLQHAAQVAEEVVQHKARKAVESRLEKEKIQRENWQKVQKSENIKRQELLMSIEKKLERSEQIFREKQTVIDNARSVARASFNVREKVRAETKTRTFDKMAKEAELYASIDNK